MLKSLSSNIKSVIKILLIQLIFLVCLSFVFFHKYSYFVVFSLLCGGITSIISSGIFSFLFFRNTDNLPKNIIRTFYLAGIAKIVSLILIFLCVFSTMIINSSVYFFSCFFIQLTFWLGCLYIFL